MSRASDATETEPLLGLRDDDVQSNQETTEIDWMSLASLAAIFALYVFSSSVLSLSTWLLTINACDGTDWSDIDEGWCKAHTIQRHVGTLMGWNMGLQAIPVLTTAVWYGSLADKFGRKPILFAAVAGEFASGAWISLVYYQRHTFPIQAIWASALFLFIGGGPRVTISMISAGIMDSVPADRRTQFLYPRTALLWFTSFTGPLFAFWLSQHSLPLMFSMAFASWALTLVAIFFFRETLKPTLEAPLPAQSPDLTGDSMGIPADAPGESEETMPAEVSTTSHPRASGETTIKSSVARIQRYVRDSCSGFLTRNLVICFTIFFFQRLAFTSETFIIEYAAGVLRWSLPKTAWIQITYSIPVIVATALILPFLNKYLQRYRKLSPFIIDSTVIKGCLLTAILGCLWIVGARSPSTMIIGTFILGLAEGLEPTIQGLAVLSADANAYGRLFTLIAVIDETATLISRPMMGLIFAASQDIGGLGRGLVFVVAAAIFSFLFGASFFLQPIA